MGLKMKMRLTFLIQVISQLRWKVTKLLFFSDLVKGYKLDLSLHFHWFILIDVGFGLKLFHFSFHCMFRIIVHMGRASTSHGSIRYSLWCSHHHPSLWEGCVSDEVLGMWCFAGREKDFESHLTTAIFSHIGYWLCINNSCLLATLSWKQRVLFYNPASWGCLFSTVL